MSPMLESSNRNRITVKLPCSNCGAPEDNFKLIRRGGTALVVCRECGLPDDPQQPEVGAVNENSR